MHHITVVILRPSCHLVKGTIQHQTQATTARCKTARLNTATYKAQEKKLLHHYHRRTNKKVITKNSTRLPRSDCGISDDTLAPALTVDVIQI